MPVEGMDGKSFVDFIGKAKAAGMTAMSQGVGDRPYPGAFLTHEILIKQLGAEDYTKAAEGRWCSPGKIRGCAKR